MTTSAAWTIANAEHMQLADVILFVRHRHTSHWAPYRAWHAYEIQCVPMANDQFYGKCIFIISNNINRYSRSSFIHNHGHGHSYCRVVLTVILPSLFNAQCSSSSSYMFQNDSILNKNIISQHKPQAIPITLYRRHRQQCSSSLNQIQIFGHAMPNIEHVSHQQRNSVQSTYARSHKIIILFIRCLLLAFHLLLVFL